MQYLYAISRRNLPVHQQAIQSAHAQLEFVRLNGSLIGHPTFIWLTVADKTDLLLLQTLLEYRGITVSAFTDPDFPDFDPSAISCLLQEDQRYLLSDLELWKCQEYKIGLIQQVRAKIGKLISSVWRRGKFTAVS